MPTLERDDGSILTEFPVIARWLALKNPQANLIPKDEETDSRAMEVMEYAVGTIHSQGFTRLFRTERFAPSPSDHEKVKEQGFFNPVQRYFGLHYRANAMPLHNQQFIDQMKDLGFHWFEEYISPWKDE